MYDLVFVGNYTKDTIVSATGTRQVDGGGFNYGAHAAAALGRRVAAVTRLAREDWRVVDRLRALGVEVWAQETPESTCLRLEYPTDNPDERVIYVTAFAGAYTPQQVAAVDAPTFVVNPSFRGEVGLDVVAALTGRGVRVAADVQGWARVVRDGRLAFESWPEASQFLAHFTILKADIVEAESLTGTGDLYAAARRLAEMGPDEIVLTHRDGLLVYAQGEYRAAGFYPAALVGRSGRGDTCLAAYVARRLSAPPAEATVWAAALTSLKMEAEGPFRRSMAEIEALIARRYAPPARSGSPGQG